MCYGAKIRRLAIDRGRAAYFKACAISVIERQRILMKPKMRLETFSYFHHSSLKRLPIVTVRCRFNRSVRPGQELKSGPSGSSPFGPAVFKAKLSVVPSFTMIAGDD